LFLYAHREDMWGVLMPTQNPVEGDAPTCFLKACACAKQMRMHNRDLPQAHVPTCLLRACACAKQMRMPNYGRSEHRISSLKG
jgi:hypothetical protein